MAEQDVDAAKDNASAKPPPVARASAAGGIVTRELWFGLGYRMQLRSRGSGCALVHGGSGHSLGLTVQGFTELSDMLRLVHPFMRVHLVHADTGHYLQSQSRSRAYVQPLNSNISTKNENSATYWNWSDERMRFGGSYVEALSKDSLLLFEVLDVKTSLRLQSPSEKGARSSVKRVAWAFLLPVGTDEGSHDKEHLNVGCASSWLTASTSSSSRPPATRETGQRRKRSDGKDADETQSMSALRIDTTVAAVEDVVSDAFDKRVLLQLHLFRSDGLLDHLQRASLGWSTSAQNTDGLSYLEEPAFPHHVPEVYMQWRRQTYLPVKTALIVDIGPSALTSSTVEDQADDGIKAGGEDDSAAVDGAEPSGKVTGRDRPHQYARNLSKETQVAIARRSRTDIEHCLVPDTLLHTVSAGPRGAMAIAFAHSGVFLAAGGESVIESQLPDPSDASQQATNSRAFALSIIDSDTAKVVWSDLRAHHGVIYQVRWSLDDRYLLSASADGACRVWDTAGLVSAVSAANASKSGYYMPFLLYSLEQTPPGFIYCALFQEFGLKPNAPMTLPRVITGSSDGRIRVYQDDAILGFLGFREGSVRDKDVDSTAPHGGFVNDLCIDCKSKNLFSGDSVGTVLVWRLDTKGWYQILRKLKTDLLDIKAVSSLTLLSVLNLQRASLANTHSQQMLLLAPPNKVAVYNTSTYKSNLGGFPGLNIPKQGQDNVRGITRANLSADGRLAISGTTTNTSSNILRVWEVGSGNVVNCQLSSLKLPFPVRGIAWHPTQHVIAVAMVGTGAGIGFYCINRESLKSKLEAEGLLVHGAADASSLLSAEVDDVDPTRKSVDKKDSPKRSPLNRSPSKTSRLQQARDIVSRMVTTPKGSARTSKASPKPSARTSPKGGS